MARFITVDYSGSSSSSMMKICFTVKYKEEGPIYMGVNCQCSPASDAFDAKNLWRVNFSGRRCVFTVIMRCDQFLIGVVSNIAVAPWSLVS